MTIKEILTPVILQEFKKYEDQGYKIKLKSTTKNRIKYTVVCTILSLLGFFLFVVPVYIYLMVKTKDNIQTILVLARKSPDKPIEQIVAEEIKI